jgi:O-antigen/teichoic acid export membrane protein
MLGSMVGPEAAGVFDVARRGVGFVAFCLGAVNMPLAPIIARLYTNGQKERMQQVVTKAAQVALIGSTPIAGGLIFYGEYFFQLYGGEFTRGTVALSILCVGQLINATVGSVVQIFNMTNNEYYIVWTKLSASTFNVILNLSLIPKFGMKGAALAVTISMMTWNISLSVLIYKKLNINTTVVGSLV